MNKYLDEELAKYKRKSHVLNHEIRKQNIKITKLKNERELLGSILTAVKSNKNHYEIERTIKKINRLDAKIRKHELIMLKMELTEFYNNAKLQELKILDESRNKTDRDALHLRHDMV